MPLEHKKESLPPEWQDTLNEPNSAESYLGEHCDSDHRQSHKLPASQLAKSSFEQA